MADFDFDAALRWARFDRQRTLARRQDVALPFITEGDIDRRGVLLDTCVYIDQIGNRSPASLNDLIERRPTNHSTIAIQELMHLVGALDPTDTRTPAAIAQIRLVIRSMPPHRVFAPDPDVLGRAALLSGMLCRLQGYAADHKMRTLHDCTLFLQAQKLGLAVLTANIADFDILLQLIPSGRALLYRRV
ncbi:type II toxin-antitoxin system VapC family toxin [Inquilinus sp. CA228]|uniref:type II toxin-antitoxin system VapC family toxin n=1 Tax=Inquilinus sp. CA228 TaxID=3455609 RepID=UPI003F8D3CB3